MTPRVLHVIPCLGKGGQERLLLESCRELARRKGVTVRIISIDPLNEYEELSQGLEIAVVPARVDLALFRKRIPETRHLRSTIADFGPDVIHTHGFQADLVVRSLGVRGPAYFTHLHDVLPEYAGFSWRTLLRRRDLVNLYERRLLFRWHSQLGNCFIAVSRYVGGFLERVLPARLRHIEVLPNAVDLSRFPPLSRRPPQKRRLRLVTIGSLQPKKNQHLLVAAVQKLASQGWDVTLAVLGDGALRSDLEASAHALGVADRIVFWGIVDNVEAMLADSELYVHAAPREAFGLSILEAMAMALPVVCLDGGGVRDLISGACHGVLVSAHNATAFANAVSAVASDGDRYNQLSRGGLLRAGQFGIEAYCDGLLGLYAKALAAQTR